MLNLIAPIKRRADGSNLPKLHLVFQASGFKTGEEWEQDEVAEWHPGVIVLFQKKAWVDDLTHMHGLELMLGDIDKTTARKLKRGRGGVEDNLSAHKTDEVMEFWTEQLPTFSNAQFIPAKQPPRVQMIDCHCGIQYKNYVYYRFCQELCPCLEKARAENNGSEGVMIPSLTPRERRILMTHAVGDFYERIM